MRGEGHRWLTPSASFVLAVFFVSLLPLYRCFAPNSEKAKTTVRRLPGESQGTKMGYNITQLSSEETLLVYVNS